MSRMWTVYVFVMLNFWKAELAPAISNLQFIPPVPGYIPVYIRPGNTPLEDINLELAEAFQSYALKQARIKTLSQNIVTEDSPKDQDFIPSNDIDSEAEEKSKANIIIQRTSQHIQKIARN
ncbi:hypothetical protein RI129_011799 [Pyrocoelia pectoralis]|uniref:Uncharacterized protein n=1 Tax=Pyrocoelia pectoralis TaxID=417401 RepID=A0AAN7ZDR0_9COLE